MDLMGRLRVLGDSARFDASCAPFRERALGVLPGVVWANRCRVLKVLMSNRCGYDCAYCVNRASSPVDRAQMEPRELADLFASLWRRGLVQGIFLSSAVVGSPDGTMERMIRALEIIRREHRFGGYVHAKVIPGSSFGLIRQMCLLADRVSVNLEVPSEEGLRALAPQKEGSAILAPMGRVASLLEEMGSSGHLKGGHTTQMILGATEDPDREVLKVSSALYRRFRLRRVYYSSYVPVSEDPRLPRRDPDRLREVRIYQADFLMRQYGMSYREILGDRQQLDRRLDPKASWALRNVHRFPVDLNSAEAEEILMVPGIGPKGVRAILEARRRGRLRIEDLGSLGLRVGRIRHFVTCDGHRPRLLESSHLEELLSAPPRQASLFQ